MSIIDMMMIARVGVMELAAVAIASSFVWAWGSLGQGVVHGMDPLVSQAHGAGDGDSVALALQRGIVVAAIVSIPIGGLWLATGWSLEFLGQDPEVARLARIYIFARLPGVLGFHFYIALRQYLAGRTLTRPAMWVMFLSNGLNIFLNWVLIFGHLGFPALGLLGAGIATGITSVMLPILLMLWIRIFGLHLGAWRAWDRRSFEARGLLQYARLGLPVGIQMWLEANAFSVATLMVGWIGVTELAAYQVVLNVASMTFMVPLGISIGAATRVGNLIGARDPSRLSRACLTALGMGAGVMAVAGVCMVLFRQYLPRLYLEEAAVVALAASLFPISAVFQIADGLQVVGGGLMRGMGRPRAGAIANLLGYYVLGLPLAWILSFQLKLGVGGILWGLAAGLGLVAILLFFWTLWTSRRPLEELRVALQ
jgi:MATE family multidrug resistance protein